MILIEPQIVAIEAEINVEASVAVVVGDRCVGECSLRRPRELKGVPLDRERAVSLIEKEQRAPATHHQQVLQPLVPKIGEERARSAVQHSDAGLFCHVFKSPVALVSIKPVRQSCRLADVKIVEAIVVIVAGRHAVVAVHIDAARAIEHRTPVIGAAKHLTFVRLHSAKRLSGHVKKDSPARAAQRLFPCLPTSGLPTG